MPGRPHPCALLPVCVLVTAAGQLILHQLGRTPCSPEVLSLTRPAQAHVEILRTADQPGSCRPNQTVPVHDCPDYSDLRLQGVQGPC